MKQLKKREPRLLFARYTAFSSIAFDFVDLQAKGLKDPTPPPDPVEQRRKYNSQYNPEIARQNEPRDERRHYR